MILGKQSGNAAEGAGSLGKCSGRGGTRSTKLVDLGILAFTLENWDGLPDLDPLRASDGR